jgi:2-aminoadipate transaminase
MKAIEREVAYIIGQPFHCDGSGANTLRLNYSFPSLEQIREGIRRMGAIL